LNANISQPVSAKDIISFRCGVRPLAAKQSFHGDCYPLELSRRYRTEPDAERPWISVFGGKLTDCTLLSESLLNLIKERYAQPAATSLPQALAKPQLEWFPEISAPVTSASWSAENELCWTLEDYLRRRTNIAQWIARGGLGIANENASHLKNICNVFSPNDE